MTQSDINTFRFNLSLLFYKHFYLRYMRIFCKSKSILHYIDECDVLRSWKCDRCMVEVFPCNLIRPPAREKEKEREPRFSSDKNLALRVARSMAVAYAQRLHRAYRSLFINRTSHHNGYCFSTVCERRCAAYL